MAIYVLRGSIWYVVQLLSKMTIHHYLKKATKKSRVVLEHMP